jgi:hypothetical protein
MPAAHNTRQACINRLGRQRQWAAAGFYQSRYSFSETQRQCNRMSDLVHGGKHFLQLFGNELTRLLDTVMLSQEGDMGTHLSDHPQYGSNRIWLR